MNNKLAISYSSLKISKNSSHVLDAPETYEMSVLAAMLRQEGDISTETVTLKLCMFHTIGNAYTVALVTVIMKFSVYFDGDALTDKAILNNELLSKYSIGTTQH